MSLSTESPPPIRSFGRIKARALKPRQAALFDTLLPQLAVPDGPIDFEDLFPPHPCAESWCEGDAGGRFILEIGFGGGEHLVAQARANPGAGFIGVEPFLNGVGSCLRHIEEAEIGNVRIHNGDARDVLARLPDASLTRIYILFPDPWPKARHHKRRLIQPDFIAELARVLKPGGEVRFATDWANYAARTLEYFTRSAAFEWLAESAADWRSPWEDHVTTRYEQKKLGDCAPVFLSFRKSRNESD